MIDRQCRTQEPASPRPSRTFSGIAIGRIWSRNTARDLRLSEVRSSQRSSKRDAGAGNFRSGRVRMSERRGNGDGAVPCAVTNATTAFSEFAPLSIVMVWPPLKPTALARGITFAPAAVAALTVVAPAVPTAAMSAVSRFAPVSIRIVSPGSNPSTLATLTLVAPDADEADSMVADAVMKSSQLLSVSRPSGKRPALVLDAEVEDKLSKAASGAGRSHVATALSDSGSCLVSLGGPWIYKSAIVEAVNHQTRGVSQDHAAFSHGDGSPEQGRVGARGHRAVKYLRRLRAARNHGNPMLWRLQAQLDVGRGRAVVFVNVTVSPARPRGNVCSPGGVAVADAGAMLTGSTP